MDDFNPLPRKEGDKSVFAIPAGFDGNFNPLPRKEGDSIPYFPVFWIQLFQSTPS